MLGIILTAILLPRKPKAKSICDEIVDGPFGLQRNKCDQLVIRYEKAVQDSVDAAKISTQLFIENRTFANGYPDQWLATKIKIYKRQSEPVYKSDTLKFGELPLNSDFKGGVGRE